jgi:hypothetical protein
MGDSCPQPDTRNRYQGRGSGDRIARLKTIAINARPLSWKRDASTITEIAKAGECCNSGCIDNTCDFCAENYPCSAIIDTPIGSTGETTATVTGIRQPDGSLRFNVFNITGCSTNIWCKQSVRLIEQVPSTFVIPPIVSCGTVYILDPSPSFYPKTIDLVIDSRAEHIAPAPSVCQVEAGGILPFTTFTLLAPTT